MSASTFIRKSTFILAMLFIAGSFTASAQSEKYVKSMEALVVKIDTTWSYDQLMAMSNSFQRIADAEKTQWLPYYYAAYCQISAGYSLMGGKTTTAQLDPIADKATILLNSAEALSKDNSEIYLIKKMIATLKLSADPMNRYMTEGPAAENALKTAKKLNPDNPRVFLLEAQDKFFTPEQFGGDKKKAKELNDMAIEKLKTQKPATTIDPAWGARQAAYLQTQMQ